jgi:hypothetical protein
MPQQVLQLQPYHEPLHVTLARTGTIALIGGAFLARWWGGLAYWPLATLVVLWPVLGGHFVELWYLNVLRPRLPAAHPVRAAVRISIWFLGGVALAVAMLLTAMALARFRTPHWRAWWLAGLVFIAIELAAHLVLLLRGRPCFYNGRG